MSLNEIKKLGDPILYEVSIPVLEAELKELMPSINRMWDLVAEFRSAYGRGRAIAAPQIGLLKRVIAINSDKKHALINPVIELASNEMMDLWDDCMSFPDLFVRVKRHKHLRISFRDINWKKQVWDLSDDMAELFQHEYDHLDGILAIDKAIDNRSFKWGGI